MQAALTALLTALADGEGGPLGHEALKALAELVHGADDAPGDVGRVDPVGLAATTHTRGVQEPALRAELATWAKRVQHTLADDLETASAVAAAMDRQAPGTGAWYQGDHVDFGQGLFLGSVVGAQVVYNNLGPVPPAMAQLPPTQPGFTGRQDDLRKLLAALAPTSGRAPGRSAVTAVTGLAGAGKTALAVEAAHAADGEGWFLGGTLFVDLHGYDAVPVTAERALHSLLRALGMPSEHIPSGEEERAAHYRTRLAERTGRVLILVDNASSPAQVRPLIPGDVRHRVLVTSRTRLPASLGAFSLSLGQLAPDASVELLDEALRTAVPDDARISDDPSAARELASLCGHLPLALQIAAALLAYDPGMPVVEFVAALKKQYSVRVTLLDDGERSICAAFALSYDRLPEDQARLLRLLALAPGSEISAHTICALVGEDTPPTGTLAGLERAYLVDRGGSRTEWRLHDLVREYALSVTVADPVLRAEAEAARSRLLRFYRRWANAADDLLRDLPVDPSTAVFESREAALDWLDRERVGLVAAVQWGAADLQHATSAVDLALCLGEYLCWRGFSDDAILVGRTARDLAGRAGDAIGEAMASNNLGRALQLAGRLEEAFAAFSRAAEIHRQIDDSRSVAEQLNNMAVLLTQMGRYEEAIEALNEARAAYTDADDPDGEGRAWNNLGLALLETGRPREAADALTLALNAFQRAGDRVREMGAWNNLRLAMEGLGGPTVE
ncbi:tetratricopeptide repeat protein [Streptomyces sp. NPDC093060]|uniref:tetratricopeptide repeat protein n=1 Tax=Streptomyces sp. NPDC093060 TaxID=3366019 RepID=UPI00382E856D